MKEKVSELKYKEVELGMHAGFMAKLVGIEAGSGANDEHSKTVLNLTYTTTHFKNQMNQKMNKDLLQGLGPLSRVLLSVSCSSFSLLH